MQAGLADVDAPRDVYRHEGVLVDESRIVVRCRQIAVARNIDGPWTRADKRFASYRCKRLLDPGIAHAGAQHDVAREKIPQIFRSIRHRRLSPGRTRATK